MRRHIEFSTELRNDHGFVGVDMTPSRLVGAEGFALTDMRPAGKIVIDGQKPLDAVAVMDFINAGCRVKVTRYENAQLYVEQLYCNSCNTRPLGVVAISRQACG